VKNCFLIMQKHFRAIAQQVLEINLALAPYRKGVQLLSEDPAVIVPLVICIVKGMRAGVCVLSKNYAPRDSVTAGAA
jgi:hypothetical protein